MKARQRGFTLIELMVVVAVVGVLLVLAFPYLNPKTTAQDVATWRSVKPNPRSCQSFATRPPDGDICSTPSPRRDTVGSMR